MSNILLTFTSSLINKGDGLDIATYPEEYTPTYLIF
jgi:hypothetical protein